MRKVRYGLFVDFLPPQHDYDSGMIGGHIYTRNVTAAALKTAGYEYYITENGEKITIKDATTAEKMNARLAYLFSTKKKKVLGVRSDVTHDPYSGPEQQLGVKTNENGKKVIDDDYYEASKDKRAGTNPTRQEREERLKRMKEVSEAQEELYKSDEGFHRL